MPSSTTSPKPRSLPLGAARPVASVLLAGILMVGAFEPPPARGAACEPAPFPSLAAACPCAGPAHGGSWRAPRGYRTCARRHLRGLVRSGEATRSAARRAYREVLASGCGVRGTQPHDAEVCGAGVVLPCDTVAAAHVDDCTECEAAFGGALVHCALYRDPAGAESSECGAGLPARRGAARAVDRRSALDCASCLAELGTARVEGVTCLRATCGPL